MPPELQKRKYLRRIAAAFIVVVLAGGAIIGVGAVRTPTGGAQSAIVEVAPATLPAVVRIGSFNIHSGRGESDREDLGLTAKTLDGLDIAGLNEVRGSLMGDNQVQELQRLTKLHGEFFPAERRFWHDDFGNAVLSRWPIRSWRRIPLPSPVAGARKNVNVVRLAGGLSVVVTHITRSADQAEQLREVARLFLSQPEPAVLMGDLNATSDDPVLRDLLNRPGVSSPLDMIHPESAGRHIDWIITRGAKVRDAGYRDLKASDHPMVWAELEIVAE